MTNQNSLKVKACSLAEEARIIRRLAYKEKKKKLHYNPAYESLYRHNKDVVALEARATHIARAFLKGKPLSSVESQITKPFKGDCSSRWVKAIKRAKIIMEKYHNGSKIPKESWDDWVNQFYN